MAPSDARPAIDYVKIIISLVIQEFLCLIGRHFSHMYFLVGKFHWVFLSGICSLALCSCASVSIHKLSLSNQSTPDLPPAEVLVTPFSVSASTLHVDRNGHDLRDFEADLKAGMTSELLEQISKHVAPSRVTNAMNNIPHGNYWLIKGEFLRVNQGSRLLRSTIGLGAGGTKMETLVTVYNLDGEFPKEFLRFQTTGGSNISQGIGGILTLPFSGPMALTSLFNAIDGLRSGVTFDTKRTAHEIAATLSDYLHKNRIPTDKPSISPKKLGQLNLGWIQLENLQNKSSSNSNSTRANP